MGRSKSIVRLYDSRMNTRLQLQELCHLYDNDENILCSELNIFHKENVRYRPEAQSRDLNGSPWQNDREVEPQFYLCQ